ncbi:MAG: LamG-like jellyroll fold domain-containing protein [Bacteroidia bacterium]
MKKILLILLLFAIGYSSNAQNIGDTIKVKTFHYGSNNRDTFAIFPDNNLSYEKIILKYNMRCKNGLVSNSTNRDQGCGEWDYSCNTYIVDSSKVEEVLSTQPNFVISNFTGNSFKYALNAPYNYYRFKQKNVIIDSTKSETKYTIGAGSLNSDLMLNASQNSGKMQFIILASELLNAGMSAGNIKGISLFVEGSGSNLAFLKIKMKHDSLNVLNFKKPHSNGFVEVYNKSTQFVTGENQLQFFNSFNWDGSSNVVVELSFTNSVPQNLLQFKVDFAFLGSSISTHNNYAIDLKNQGFARLDTTGFSTINKEFTIQFWAYGDASLMPASNSILYAYPINQGERQLNIHLPHGSNNIYFDCGYAAGGYDRINKIATSAEQGGRWNHWTFTKNATTGSMKIYLNGNLWHSGTGKTKLMNILNLLLGKDQTGGGNYKGKINDLSFWNKEIPDSLIKDWMFSNPNQFHPMSQNLVSYYPMNEALGNQMRNLISNVLVNGENFSWAYDRGEELNRSFNLSEIRPKVSLIKGDYVTQISDVFVLDSLPFQKSVIQKYSINSKANQFPIASDEIKLDTVDTQYYPAFYSKIFDGETMELLDSIDVLEDGVFQVSNLNYYRRFPFYNEIMSFVTPYGIGLNFGQNGRTWYFDVTDFAPLLKGKKRILMTLGGQNQEQMDLEFWFVVGTPPRPVLEFNQIWQGTNRTGAAGIGSINNNSRYFAVDVPTLSTGKSFKLRSTITGHGAEGEFEANGGVVNHMLNINGGDTDYVWRIYSECSKNPVFPQGGTWVYDREGWCPGERSLLKEFNITPKLNPGSKFSLDYASSLPPKAGGDYRYHIAHQLVTYGDPSFNLDARVYDIQQPSDKVLYTRLNPACSKPQITIQNTGRSPITQVEILYWVNSGEKQTFTWTGNLNFLDTQSFHLPIGAMWLGNVKQSGNKFYAEIKTVNGQADEYVYNNKMESPFNRPEVLPGKFTLEFYTNNNPTENSYEILDESGNVIDSKTFTKATTLHSNTYELSGCYRLKVKDKGADGVQWWANSSQGTGFIRFKNTNGTVIKTIQPDFGSEIEYGFTTDWFLSKEEISFGKTINLYPNPTSDKFVLEGADLIGAQLMFTDILGHQIEIPFQTKDSKVFCETLALSPGIYFVVISKNGNQVTKTFAVH